ncbi:MAG: DUF2635 domain-containing protein [Desulfovibrionaceae bacterium]|jgi:hypothetical protein
MTTIIVQAAPGLRVPLEGAPRRYITDATPVTVPDSAYYRRRLADGDLLQVPDTGTTEGNENG